MRQDFIIHTKMLETVVWIFDKVNTFPKKQRFVLGQQIENGALNSLRLIVEANNATSQDMVIQKLANLNIELKILKDLLRVANEMNFMTIKSLGYITSEIDEVGKMGGSWLKRQKRSLSKKLV